MYNLNLDYYSVEQESNETGLFSHDSWSSNSKGALNDVVDPNTEFKITPSSVAPVSTLESYGFSKAPSAKFCTETTDTTKIILRQEKNTPTMPTSARGSVSSVQQKVRNPLSASQEIPQVHGAKKATSVGRQSNGTHTTNGTSPTTKQTPASSALAVGKRKQPSSITNTSRGKHDNGCETLSLDGEATTASQLAWAFRNARDRADVESNTSRCSSRFDLESNFSERADTFSTTSGVSGYEEELFRIRRLLLLDTARSYQEKLLDDFDRKSSILKDDLHLHNANPSLQPKEASKDAALLVSPEWRGEYEHVLGEKMNASARLQEVHAEVEALRHAMSDKTSLEPDVEPKPRDQSNGRPLDLAASNERLRIELQELRLDSESRESAVRGLKLKVAAQHADIAALTSLNRAAESRTASRRNDLDAARKSAAWYREQLHAARAATLRAEQALMSARAAALSANHAAERLADEAAAARALVEETRRRAVADKDALVTKLEAIHAGMLEREAAILAQLRRENLLVEPAPVHCRARPGGAAGGEGEPPLGEVRAKLDERDSELSAARAANAELGKKVAKLQATITERTVAADDLRDRLRTLKLSHDTAADKLAATETAVARIAGEKAALEVALTTAAREKSEVDSAVAHLRDNFERIERQYQTMQGALTAKDSTQDSQRGDLVDDQRKDVVSGSAAVEARLRVLLSSLSEMDAFESLLRELSAESTWNGRPDTGLEAGRACGVAERVAEVEARWRNAGGGRDLCAAAEGLLAAMAGRSEGDAANGRRDASGGAEGGAASTTEPTAAAHADAGPLPAPSEVGRLRADVSRLASERGVAAETLDGVRVALGRSEAMAHVLRATIARLQRDLDAEQVAHENCKADRDRAAAAETEARETQAAFPPDWEAELASLREDKAALQAQVGELREATQSTLQQNKLLRLRLDALSKPPRADRLPPPPPPARYDDGGAMAALMQSTAPPLPRNEPLADLQGCLDSLKTEMATLQRQLMAKARGDDDTRFDV